MKTICAECKKVIRETDDFQVPLHTEIRDSHGICDDCKRLLYPDIFPSPAGPDGPVADSSDGYKMSQADIEAEAEELGPEDEDLEEDDDDIDYDEEEARGRDREPPSFARGHYTGD